MGIIITQLENFTNANLEIYRKDYDEWGRPCMVVMPPSIARVSLSGNRLSALRKRKANRTSYSYRKREKIEGYSKSAGYRMEKYLRECTVEYKGFGTLTFDDCPTGVVAKRSLSRFLKRIRRAYVNQPEFSLFWFMEFQKRGSIHFHFFTSVFIPKDFLSRAWLESCESSQKFCHTSIEGIRSGRYGMCKYAKKYAKKAEQKVLPENFGFAGRWWGKIGITDVAAATTEIDFNMMNHAEIAPKVLKLAEFVEKGVSEGWIFQREVTKYDPATDERVRVGITLWEVRAGFKLRTIVQLFNELIDDPEKRLKYQSGWICGEQIRQNSKKRPA